MKLLFCGDIVINNPDRYMLSYELRELINSHAVKCCNFEAPILDDTCIPPLIKAGPAIHQSSDAAEAVLKSGFNVISLANNHVMDFGESGLQKTIQFFNDRNITHIGAGCSFEKAYKPVFFCDKGKTVGILALAEAQFGVLKNEFQSSIGYAWIHHPKIFDIIRTIKSTADILIIFAHAGLEDESIPLPEWQSCYRKLVDWGADIIIASHPHIIQGHETYSGKNIFYSLGNFYFDMESMVDNLEWNRSIIISIDTDKLEDIEVIPVSVKNFTVDFDRSFMDDIALRSSYLIGDVEYDKMSNLLAEKLWGSYYRSYYENAVTIKGIENMSLTEIIKHIIKRIFLKNKLNAEYAKTINETLLLHNIQIESHRYLVERYLFNQNIKENRMCKK